MSYQKETNGSLKVLEENNYYPFGLKHSGYNNTNLANANYKYKYQGQELQDELGLGWYSFKWRNYDPAIGRFFNVDPLSEKYEYQSPYNFAENKLGAGIELEGLEIGLAQNMALSAGSAAGISAGSAQTMNGGVNVSRAEEQIIELGTAYVKAENNFQQKKWGFFTKIGLGIIAGFNWILNNDSDNSKKETLKENQRKGKEAEKEVTGELEQEFPEDEVLTQVTGKFEDGSKTVFDNVVIDSKTGKVKQTNETKSGNAQQTNQQKRYRNGESVELRGKNAGSAKGQKIDVKNTPDRETRKP
ncbi:RHS repeat domain-containing protein [Empedobacter tilapiae]